MYYILLEITIYADGSCIKKTGAGGYCAIIRNGKSKIGTIKGGSQNGNNNMMELLAVLEPLNLLSRMKNSDQMDVSIYSDSSYVVDGKNVWQDVWINNGWVKYNGEPVKNTDMWKTMVEIVKTFNKVKIKWVKRNSNNTCIECDRIAKAMSREVKRVKHNFMKHDLPKEIYHD